MHYFAPFSFALNRLHHHVLPALTQTHEELPCVFPGHFIQCFSFFTQTLLKNLLQCLFLNVAKPMSGRTKPIDLE